MASGTPRIRPPAPPRRPPHGPGRRAGAAVPLLPAALLLLSVVLVFDPWGHVSPAGIPGKLDPAWVDPTLPRTPFKAPKIDIEGEEMSCSDCHSDTTPPPEPKLPLEAEHTHIRLNHGENNRCFNCHHPLDRDHLVGYGGEKLPFDNAEGKCGKCHGNIDRDWKRNIHGRRTGFWDPKKGEAQVGQCNHCHQPHSPKFKPMKACPPPRAPDTHLPAAAGPPGTQAPTPASSKGAGHG